jgi:predicted transcriptional regulator
MSVQVTSIISYYEVLQTLSKRHKEVLLAMKHLKCANNLMISKLLNLPINSVTPRMKELRTKGIIIYHHTEACPYTKRSSRFYTIKNYIMECM